MAIGKLTLAQINLIYRHLPIDLTFVDENDIVKFYTDTPVRVFQPERRRDRPESTELPSQRNSACREQDIGFF